MADIIMVGKPFPTFFWTCFLPCSCHSGSCYDVDVFIYVDYQELCLADCESLRLFYTTWFGLIAVSFALSSSQCHAGHFLHRWQAVP